MMIKKWHILLLIIICFACASKSDNNKTAIRLGVNSCFDKFSTKARICLDSVYNDSRCATGYECVWEGDALAAFTLIKNESPVKFNLHVNSKFQNDTVINGFTIKLLDISPYPIADQPIDPSAYVAEISVHEN